MLFHCYRVGDLITKKGPSFLEAQKGKPGTESHALATPLLAVRYIPQGMAITALSQWVSAIILFSYKKIVEMHLPTYKSRLIQFLHFVSIFA